MGERHTPGGVWDKKEPAPGYLKEKVTDNGPATTPAPSVPVRSFDAEAICFIFGYHPPTSEQREVYEQINAAYIECAMKIKDLMPDGPGKTVAIRKLSDARMATNAAVALQGRF